ncbi:TonB-dependent receptor [Mucilaginibacter psychrotolerans]|uniref:TonB-dependent receptor n=1 Tax=Mucilaginibacter psychrotolerans TaxID=1524096 RepID=A0A4Y8SPS1_9SPHI|nr:TonB-dependent receptor [Mucilaginibacter psychrotolerans]TFF40404.1 TonB-dependent receptor [Mucilaginibacter psychrotolerans]
MKLKLISSLFFLFIQFAAFADANIIKGKVVDAKTNETLIGAVVSVPDLHISVATSANGEFVLRSVPSTGKYVVQVQYVSYKTITQTVDFASATPLLFAMQASVVEAHEVVITGTPITAGSRSNSTSATVVGKEQLQGSSTNLIDALARQVPGFSQITTSQAISKPVIRGLSYNRVVTLNDGVKQQGQQFGDEHGIEIDQFQAERVEVLRGAASLMYGSDALGGVINIIDPPSPAEGTVKGEVLSNYSTNSGLINTSLMLTGNENGFVWRGRGTYQNAHSYNTPAGYFQNSGFNQTDVNGMLGVNKAWGYSHLNFSYFKTNIGFFDAEPGDNLYSNTTSRTLDYPKQDIRHYKLAWNNNFIFGGSSLKLDLGFQKNQRRELEDNPSPVLFFDLNTYSLDAKYYMHEFDGWHPVIGLSASLGHSVNKGVELLVPAYDEYSTGAFGYIKKVWDKNTFSAGLRVDYIQNKGKQQFVDGEEVFTGFDNKFGNLSGALGYTHAFNDALSFKANAGTAFRAPNPAELGSNGVHEGTNRYEIGNGSLAPERSYQADATLEYGSGFVTGSFGIYENYIHNYIYASNTNNEQITVIDPTTNQPRSYDAYRYGQVNANLYGFEGNLTLHPVAFLHFENTFSYTRAQNESFDRPLPLIPAGVLHNTLRFEPKVKGLSDFYLSAGIDNYFKQTRIDATFETPADGYTLLNAGVGATFKLGAQPLKIYVSGNNLTNKRYYDALSRLRPGRYSQEDPTFGVYNPGRNITFGFYLPFGTK